MGDAPGEQLHASLGMACEPAAQHIAAQGLGLHQSSEQHMALGHQKYSVPLKVPPVAKHEKLTDL